MNTFPGMSSFLHPTFLGVSDLLLKLAASLGLLQEHIFFIGDTPLSRKLNQKSYYDSI